MKDKVVLLLYFGNFKKKMIMNKKIIILFIKWYLLKNIIYKNFIKL